MIITSPVLLPALLTATVMLVGVRGSRLNAARVAPIRAGVVRGNFDVRFHARGHGLSPMEGQCRSATSANFHTLKPAEICAFRQVMVTKSQVLLTWSANRDIK